MNDKAILRLREYDHSMGGVRSLSFFGKGFEILLEAGGETLHPEFSFERYETDEERKSALLKMRIRAKKLTDALELELKEELFN